MKGVWTCQNFLELCNCLYYTVHTVHVVDVKKHALQSQGQILFTF